MKNRLARIVQSAVVKKCLTVLGILFLILTYFISIQPDRFMQFGYIGIAVFNMVSSGLLLIPVLTKKLNLIPVVIFSAVGNAFNTSINYLIGYNSNSLFSGVGIIQKMKSYIKRFGLFAVYVLAIIPLPLDANGLLSGYLGIPYKKYIVVNFLGKITVFLLVGIGLIFLPKVVGK